MCWRLPLDFKFGHFTSLFRRGRQTNIRHWRNKLTGRVIVFLIKYANVWLHHCVSNDDSDVDNNFSRFHINSFARFIVLFDTSPHNSLLCKEAYPHRRPKLTSTKMSSLMLHVFFSSWHVSLFVSFVFRNFLRGETGLSVTLHHCYRTALTIDLIDFTHWTMNW